MRAKDAGRVICLESTVQKILLPTDGSAESEKALAIAWRVAQAQDAELILARVVEPLTESLTAAGGDVSPEAFQRYHHAALEEAEADLHRMGARVQSGVRERIVLLSGPVESALLDYEDTERPDLVVLATHGRTGLARLAFGSVADRLIRDGVSPVLVVRRSSPATTVLRRGLLMLDGSALAEKAVPIVQELAGKPLLSLVLYRAVRNLQNRDAAQAYLDTVAERFASSDVEVQVIVDVGEKKQPTVAKAAADVDLIVLCTHGRGGFDRLRHGSVAEFVMHTVDKPILLVRGREQAA
jgi:nucleotide-binding universal stress UspA family protein